MEKAHEIITKEQVREIQSEILKSLSNSLEKIINSPYSYSASSKTQKREI